MKRKGECQVAMRLPMEGDSEGVPVVVDANDVYEREMRGRSEMEQRAVRNRPYCCSNGSKMMIVICKARGNHFRHYSDAADHGATGSASACGGCGCSEEHLTAQRLIVDNVRRLKVMTWRRCRKHVAETWSNRASYAVMEKSSRFNGRRVRYDTAIYCSSTNRLIKIIEVRKTSKTDPGTRPDFTSEVHSAHVISQFDIAGQGDVILHDLFVDPSPCPECERRAAEERKETARMEEERRAAEERKETARMEEYRRAEVARQKEYRRAEVARREEYRKVQAAQLAEQFETGDIECEKALQRQYFEGEERGSHEELAILEQPAIKECLEWFDERLDLHCVRHTRWRPGTLRGKEAIDHFESWKSDVFEYSAWLEGLKTCPHEQVRLDRKREFELARQHAQVATEPVGGCSSSIRDWLPTPQ